MVDEVEVDSDLIDYAVVTEVGVMEPWGQRRHVALRLDPSSPKPSQIPPGHFLQVPHLTNDGEDRMSHHVGADCF